MCIDVPTVGIHGDFRPDCADFCFGIPNRQADQGHANYCVPEPIPTHAVKAESRWKRARENRQLRFAAFATSNRMATAAGLP